MSDDLNGLAVQTQTPGGSTMIRVGLCAVVIAEGQTLTFTMHSERHPCQRRTR